MPAIDLHHLAIKTDDLDATVAFWNGIVGSHSVERPDFDFPGAWLQFGTTMIHLYGGDAATNAAILSGILKGEIRDARRQVVLLNAAAALTAAAKSDSLRAGYAIAEQAIDSGAAQAKLDELVTFTQQ